MHNKERGSFDYYQHIQASLKNARDSFKRLDDKISKRLTKEHMSQSEFLISISLKSVRINA